MPKEENNKSGKWKFWGMVITGALAAYSTIFVSLISSSGAKESSIKTIVQQLNERVIPQLQELMHKQDEEIDKLKDKNADLRERLAKIEGMFMVREEAKSWAPHFGRMGSKESKKKTMKRRKLHKVNMEQVLK